MLGINATLDCAALLHSPSNIVAKSGVASERKGHGNYATSPRPRLIGFP